MLFLIHLIQYMYFDAVSGKASKDDRNTSFAKKLKPGTK